MKKQRNVFFLFCILAFSSNAQQQDMYTFCAKQTKIYLLDTNATNVTTPAASVYKSWTTSSATSYSAYLLPGDTILQTVAYKVNGSPGQGGTTGKVRKIRWDGTVVWEYGVSTTTTQMHHDVCGMPNGNVLLIVYETKSASPTTVGSSSTKTVWAEKIIEVKPTGVGTNSASWGGTIVWEWHVWDHLCQSVYPNITATYVSSVSEHPERMNVNYSLSQDWHHMNGIDYNPALNQIILSSHMLNEVYVIDHSTTTAEAASHSGGNSGKGGDFLYRWGNPAAYGLTAGGNNSGFKVIHDAHWVPADNPLYPNWMCAYNNNQGSNVQVVLWNPPYNGYNYTYTAGSIIGPTTCTKPTIPSYTANDQGNSQQLPNGNMLVNNPTGSIYEISQTGTVLQTIASTQSAHAYRYTKCYVRGPVVKASVSNASICLGNQIELGTSVLSVTETNPTYTYSWSSPQSQFTAATENPSAIPPSEGSHTYTVTVTNTAIGCSQTASVNVTVEVCSDIQTNEEENNEIEIYPNPSDGIVYVKYNSDNYSNYDVYIRNSIGQIVRHVRNVQTVDLSGLPEGLYYFSFIADKQLIFVKKLSYQHN